MSFFKNDTIISRSLKEYGEWAQAELEFLLTMIKPRDVVIDVGAFIGTHTVAFASRVVDGGQVYAFEPQPVFFEVLKKNIGQNVLPNVQLFNVALSDNAMDSDVQRIDIRNCFNFAGTGIFDSTSATNDSATCQRISIMMLDQLAIDRCDLIKIDAENMEINVLKGSRQTLRATRPIVFSECNSLEFGWPVVEFMEEEDYRIYLLNVPAYNVQNFRQKCENFFGDGREAGLVLIPAERNSAMQDHLNRLQRRQLLIPILCLDDLALGLLKKPQYKYEVISKARASNALGVGFWANETEVAQFRKEATALKQTIQAQQQLLSQTETEILGLKQQKDHWAQQAVQYQEMIQTQQVVLSQKEIEISGLNEVIKQKETAQDGLVQEAMQYQQTIHAQQQLLIQKGEEIYGLKSEYGRLADELAAKNAIINRIYDSHGWKALLVYYRLRERLFPDGTRRRGFAKKAFHLLLKVKKATSIRMHLISAVSDPYSADKNKYEEPAVHQTQTTPESQQIAQLFVSDIATTSVVTDYGQNRDYLVLSEQISTLRKSYIERLHMKPLSMISVRETELLRSAHSLIFPAEDQVEVSIVIPVFNNVRFTLECLISVMKYSTGISYEVIVVDDCSSDRTPELLSSVPNIIYIRNEKNLGFVHTCNRGAEKARGSYVLLLSNEAQVTENWLQPLVETFKEYENVGSVGSKILFPDGRLQEAGAMVNCDGTSTFIGLSDNPDLPRYNYVREVPYCSGACLLVEANLFRELGGFDASLAPGNCADWDLAFRIREQGLRILYNPKSVIIHHLSRTVDDFEDDFKMVCVIRNQQKLSEKWQGEIDNLNKIKLIALYLPQFHPIPENDRWWGTGFTEWTNVTKARPNYIGHYQPHLPADLGFYDLRVEETMEQQAELAKRYGIHGFCYFYYWFGGKRLLDLPLERMLRTDRPDMPFCLCWANENWTRRWDGLENETLIAQQHSDDDDRAVIHDLTRYMRHPSYIRIHGKPILIVYRITLFPDIKRTVKIWRELCREEAIGEIYLIMAESFEHSISHEHPIEYGFDAAMEYPPHGRHARMDPPGRIVNSDYGGIIYDYREFVLNYFQKETPNYTRFRTVMPSWDNTSRRQNDPMMFENTSPGAYQACLEAVLQRTHEERFGDERIVFINAWNEWAEGNHIEPDRRYGHGFLEAIRNAKDCWLIKKD